MRWMFAGAFLGRLPYAMESLGTVVFLKSAVGSYAVAGEVAGALAAGIAAGTIVQGRHADRRGGAAFVPLATLHLMLMVALVIGGLDGFSAALLAGVGFGAGCALPPTSSVFRTLYPAVLAPATADLHTAFAFDALLTEITYLAAPGVVSLGVLLAVPDAALLIAATSALGSALALSLRGPGAKIPPSQARRTGVLSALGTPGVRAMALASLPISAAYGVCEVAFPAFGSAQGQIALGGLLLSVMAAGTAISALVYGLVARRSDPARIFLRHSLALGPMYLILSLGSTTIALALLAIILGGMIGPWLVSRNQLTLVLASPAAAIEAYSWQITALFLGTSVGTTLAGPVVDQAGWQVALVAAGLIAAITGLVALAHRGTLDTNR